MTMQIEEINTYVSLYDEIRGRVDSTDEAIAIMQEIGKDRRCQRIGASKLTVNLRTKKGATTKQIAYMKYLGIDVPAECTGDEASNLIDSALGRNPPEVVKLQRPVP